MTSVERLLCRLLTVAVLLIGAWFGICRYGIEQRRAGYDAAVADGRELRDLEAQIARETETALRAQLRVQDHDAYQKEKEHADSLEAAQRRLRAGVDRLRCPAGPVPASAAAGDRPAAAGPALDGGGPAIVPEDAAAILGDAADVAGLVRRYERVVGRFEACRALNAQ